MDADKNKRLRLEEIPLTGAPHICFVDIRIPLMELVSTKKLSSKTDIPLPVVINCEVQRSVPAIPDNRITKYASDFFLASRTQETRLVAKKNESNNELLAEVFFSVR